MANVGFRLGLQSAADTIIANGRGAEEGSFYLTSDSHRLYIGAPSESSVGEITLYAVNEGVTTVQNLNALQAVAPTNPAESKACTGRFYYLIDENILCIYNGQQYVQINEDTNNAISSVTFDGQTTNNSTVIKETITDASGNKKDASFTIATDTGITSNFDVTTKTLSISGDTYTMTSTVSSRTNGVTLHLESKNTDNDSDVTIVGDGIVEINQEDNVITISAEDCQVDKVDVTNVLDGVKVTVTDSKGNSASGFWRPVIQYGALEGSEPFKVQFNNGTAVLDVYAKSEIDQLLRDLNAMTYKGTVGDSGSYGSGFHIASGGNWIIDNSAQPISSHIGDMVVLSNELAIGNKTYAKGTMVICRSSDDTETIGVIPASKLEFDIIESEQNSDTTFVFSRLNDTTAHGIQLKSNSGDSVGNITFKPGELDAITINGEQRQSEGLNILIASDYITDPGTGVTKATISIRHQTIARSDRVDDIVQNEGQDLQFTVVESIETDDTGHIVEVVTKRITIKDLESKVSEVKYTTSAYTASDNSTIGVVTNAVATEDSAGSITRKSESFNLISKSLTITNNDGYGPTAESEQSALKEGLSIEMTWGSF